MSILQYFYSHVQLKEIVMSGIEEWRSHSRLLRDFIEVGRDAINLGLLNEDETKEYKAVVREWIAQDDAIKRPKPRRTAAQISWGMRRYKQCSPAWRNEINKLNARDRFDFINKLREWLAEDTAINSDKQQNLAQPTPNIKSGEQLSFSF